MLQQTEPEDFVIATGEQHSVREFVEQCRRAAWLCDRVARHGRRRTGRRCEYGRTDRQDRSALLPADRGRDLCSAIATKAQREARLAAGNRVSRSWSQEMVDDGPASSPSATRMIAREGLQDRTAHHE